MQLTVVYVCSLLTLAAVTSRVNTQDVCYHPPVDCQKPGGGSWLQAMQPSTARAQQEATAYACDCCCMTTGCTFSESLCGNPRGCDVSSCYALILEKAADSSTEDPGYSAKVMAAALKVKKIQQQREKAEVQYLMAKLAQNNIQSNNEHVRFQDKDQSIPSDGAYSYYQS